jgi:hypothetical protein
MPERVPMRTVIAAELLKLWTLPAVILTVATTVVLTGLLTLALSANGDAATVQVTTYSQIGVVLVGILAATSEYDDRQIVTSLISVPDRLLLAGAKAVACALAVAGTATLTVAAAHLAVVNRLAETSFASAAGTIVYLIVLALFGHGLGLLLRGTIPALVTVLLLAYVASPLLGRVGDYLPGQAGSQLHQSNPGVGLSTAALVAWAVAALVASTSTFLRRDAA